MKVGIEPLAFAGRLQLPDSTICLYNIRNWLECGIRTQSIGSQPKVSVQTEQTPHYKLVTGENFEISTFGFQNRHSASELPRV